jgi:chromosome segregation ATPase
MAAKEIDVKLKLDAKQAQSDIKDVDKALGDLDETTELSIDVDNSDAESKIDQTTGDLNRIDSTDVVADIHANISDAKADLQTLEEQAQQTNKELDRTTGEGGGSNLRGNAIADLTGPLGEASGAASDFAGVFDGLGDIAEATASKLGASSQVAAGLSSAVGGLGVAVAAGAAIWSLWTSHQQAAKKKAEEMSKAMQQLTQDIKDGDKAAAIADFRKSFPDAIDLAHKLGQSVEDVTRFVTGQIDTLPDLATQWQNWNDVIDASTGKGKQVQEGLIAQRDQFKANSDALVDLRQKYIDSGKAADETAKTDEELAKGLNLAKDAQKNTTQAVKDSIAPLDNAKSSVDELESGYSNLQDRLSTTRAIEDFKNTMIEAQKTIAEKGQLTQDEMRGVEDSIVQAGQAAKLNPIVIDTAIQKADQGDIDGAFLYLQQQIDAKGPIHVQLHPDLPQLTKTGKPQALGGPVVAGVAYPVGERGRETFIPYTDGVILPHGQEPAGAYYGGNTTIINHFPPGVNPESVAIAQRKYQRRGGR